MSILKGGGGQIVYFGTEPYNHLTVNIFLENISFALYRIYISGFGDSGLKILFTEKLG